MLSDIAAEKDVNQSQIMVVGVLSLSHDSIQRTFVARETHSCSQQSLLVQIQFHATQIFLKREIMSSCLGTCDFSHLIPQTYYIHSDLEEYMFSSAEIEDSWYSCYKAGQLFIFHCFFPLPTPNSFLPSKEKNANTQNFWLSLVTFPPPDFLV